MRFRFVTTCAGLLLAGGLGAAPSTAAPTPADAVACKPVTAENTLTPPLAPKPFRDGSQRLSAAQLERLSPAKQPCAADEVPVPAPVTDAPPPITPSPDATSPFDRQALLARGYTYAGDTWQHAGGFGFYTAISLEIPAVAAGAHSIGQIAVANDSSIRYTVEEGWRKTDSMQYPQLFVYINRDHYASHNQPGGDCYNCNFIPQAGARWFPGQSFLNSGPVAMEVQYLSGNWWVWFADQWIGHIAGSFWNPAFTTTSVQTAYGEVLDTLPPTTDMGNGLPGSNSSAARMSNPFINLDQQGNTSLTVALHSPPNNVTDSSLYSIGTINATRRDWHWGGPGN